MVRFHGPGRGAALLLVLAGLGTLPGCVTRRYTIRSNPPGAQVIVNDELIGPTPVSRSFTYYGDRQITLMKDGYATKTVIQPVKAPWYDNLATEFFTENFIPYTFRDEREFTYNLEPAVPPSQENLLNNANGLRSEASSQPPPRRGGILGYLGF